MEAVLLLDRRSPNENRGLLQELNVVTWRFLLDIANCGFVGNKEQTT